MTSTLISALFVLTRLLIAFALFGPAFNPVSYPVSETCSERALDTALATAQPGSTVVLACDGKITISATKTITRDLSIEGSASQLVLISATTQPIFRIAAGTHVTIKSLSFLQGGIENHGSLVLSASRIEASENGLVNFSIAQIDHSTFTGNLRSAIFNAASLSVRSSLFTGNGRGLDNASGNALIINSTFYANKIPRPKEIGAAIANSGTLKVVNSTFDANDAPGGGGAIGNHGAGVVTLTNTILSGKFTCYGLVKDGGHNLQYPGTTCGSSIPTLDPSLDPLAANGGLTDTLALQAGSPAIRAGDKSVCAGGEVGNLDALDHVRFGCDIGAVEFSTRLLIWAEQNHGSSND